MKAYTGVVGYALLFIKSAQLSHLEQYTLITYSAVGPESRQDLARSLNGRNQRVCQGWGLI